MWTNLEARKQTLLAVLLECSLSSALAEKPLTKLQSVYLGVSSLASRLSWLMEHDSQFPLEMIVGKVDHGSIPAAADSSTENSANCSSERPLSFLEVCNSVPC